MASLWRAMALVWLGGMGSPILADDPAIMMGAPVAGFGSEIQAAGLQPAASETPSEFEKHGNVQQPVTKI
jgi:hypothetical protein